MKIAKAVLVTLIDGSVRAHVTTGLVAGYSQELRGPSQNRFGGQKTQGLRTYGGPFGAAGPVRRLSRTEIKEWEDDYNKRSI